MVSALEDPQVRIVKQKLGMANMPEREFQRATRGHGKVVHAV
jgi:hypothetical protein